MEGFLSELNLIIDSDQFQGGYLKASHLIRETRSRGGRIYLVGNGGSVAICSHVSVDLNKACGIKSTVFTDASLITCYANDYGYENVYSKCLEEQLDPEDAVILISSSGQSKNIHNALLSAKQKEVAYLTLTGFREDNIINNDSNHKVWVSSNNYNVVEVSHLAILLAGCESNKLSRRG